MLRLLIETSDKPGALEIVAGRTRLDAEGTPTRDIELLMWTKDMSDEQRANLPHRRKFFFVDPAQPATIAAALRYARDMRDRYGNVYFGRCLYEPNHKGKYRRDERFAVPNRLVFVDDVKPDQARDFAVYIQTSEASGHAYKLLDRSLNAVQYADVARRLAAHYGGDASGVDYVQLGRWPNTTNTKGHAAREGYRVRLMRFVPAQVETLEALRAAYPQPESLGGSTYAPRPSGAAPGNWRSLPDGAALIASGRWRWMCENRAQIKMLLDTHEPVITYRKITGHADISLSAQRAALVSNLLQLHRPPPLAEIRAVALELKPHIGTDLTDEQYRTAIDREIVTYLHTHYASKGKEYQPTPTTGIKAAPAEPRSRGRPYSAEQARAAQLDRLRTILRSLPANDYGVVTPSATAIAAQLGKSARMVRNYLHDLAELKEINFASGGKGRQISIILLDRFGKPNQPEHEKEIKSAPNQLIEAPVLPIATPEAPIAASLPIESTGDQGVYVLPPTREAVSDFQPTDQAPAQRPARLKLSDAVREVFDRLRVDQGTGERKRVYSKQVREALADLGTWPAAAIEQAIEDERDRRRFAAIVADIQTMKPGTLRAQIRLMERLGDKSRIEGTNMYRYAEWAAREMRAELGTRPAEAGRKPRKNCEALPNLRAAGEQAQAELWQVAERGLAELRTRRPAPAPEQHQVDYAAVRDAMIARLQAQAAQRQQVAL